MNARFKSTFAQPKKVTKTASYRVVESAGSIDRVPRYSLPRNHADRVRVHHNSMRMAEKKVRPLLFQKESNAVSFESLKMGTLVEAKKSFQAREIPNSKMNRVGTVQLLTKSRPMIEKVGYTNHPQSKNDVKALEQEALRNLASLPTLLKRLQGIRQIQKDDIEKKTASNNASAPSDEPTPQKSISDETNIIIKQDNGNKPEKRVAEEEENSGQEAEDQRQLSRARHLSETFETLLLEIDSSSRERVGEHITSALEREGIGYGQRRSHRTFHAFLSDYLDQLRAYINERGGSQDRRAENI